MAIWNESKQAKGWGFGEAGNGDWYYGDFGEAGITFTIYITL